jgi:formamidopyrimidine-DNA glycosylase
MPELPDIVAYVEALRGRIAGHTLQSAVIRGPFLLRSANPPIEAAYGRKVREVRRLGKQIAIGVDNDLWLVLHLKIAGRLHWRDASPKMLPKNILAAFEFDSGALHLTEAGSQHRASLHVAAGEQGLSAFNAGGLEVLDADIHEFVAVLRSSNHTLKRALTDPRLLSGIGNAYSDEIVHAAGLSPIAMTRKLTDAEVEKLYDSARGVLTKWVAELRAESAGGFPKKVTAFREGMAVHGRFGKPCPRCGAKIQRIRYASNETNYCPMCQTGGKLLADRALSRLLREDWPRTVDELEAMKTPDQRIRHSKPT